jgi:predicted nucleic acid-binding protein
VTDKVIINASPLIFLSRSHHLALLKSFADEVWVPEPVAEEILRRALPFKADSGSGVGEGWGVNKQKP